MPGAEHTKLIFVSHSGQDTWVARQIANGLAACGATPFLDEANIDIGAKFEEDLRTFLNRADELLVFFTPWSLYRPYVLVEIGAAWLRGIPIIVVLYGLSIAEFQAQSNLPLFLKERDIINLNDIDQYFEQLKQRIKHESNKEL